LSSRRPSTVSSCSPCAITFDLQFMSRTSKKNRGVCLVAIVKDEEPFLDEWLVYHRMLGVDHFFIYDDHPAYPMEAFLKPHREYVTVVPWFGQDALLPGRTTQTKAYVHAVVRYVHQYSWVGFLDVDEFVVLRQDERLHGFLDSFPDAAAVSLNWHVFGHCGYYDNPPGLITASLIRRMSQPSEQVKTFTRPGQIAGISSPHYCELESGGRVDANGRRFATALYPERTQRAHINHYQCRSFRNWMGRVERGDVTVPPGATPEHDRWRWDPEACLRQFVMTVAKDKNEYVDEFMFRYQADILQQTALLGREGTGLH